MSKYFLELSSNVFIKSRKLSVLKETAHELEQATGRRDYLAGKILLIACDVRNFGAFEAIKDKTLD